MSHTPDEKKLIKLALQDILASPHFANSSQLGNFLSFIVTKTLDGKKEEIKGYTIGVDALGRPDDFDPQVDPSVRVMAGRLRQALENYNRETGGFTQENQTVEIELVKGSYVPKFEFREAKTETEINYADKLAALETDDIDIGLNEDQNINKPILKKPRNMSWAMFFTSALALVVIVLAGNHFYDQYVRIEPTLLPEKQFISIEDATLPSLTLFTNADPSQMPDWITAEKIHSTALVSFSRFNEYRIFDYTGEDDLLFLDNISSDYYLSMYFSTASDGETLEAFLTLTRPQENEIVWSDRLTFPPSKGEQIKLNLKKIADITSAIMSPYGIIHGDITSNKFPPPRLDCIRAIYSYFAKENLQAYANGLDCARRATSRPNASSSMYAMLTFLYVEAYRKQIIEVSDDPLKEASIFVKKAITLDPGNARAFQALFAIEKTSGNKDAAIEAALKAISLNPYDRDILGDYAAYLISINEQEKAKPILEQAVKLTPVLPAWLSFYAYLNADTTGDYEKADKLADKFVAEDSPLLAAAIMLAAERQKDVKRAHAAANTLNIIEPDFAKNPRSALLRRGFEKSFANEIAERLEDAGLNKKFTLNEE